MLTYDTGALIAAEGGDRAMWALHEAALRRGLTPAVPTVVLAQAWRGGPQAQLSRLLKGCIIEPLSEGQARATGEACAASRTNDIVDSAVVVSAATRHDSIVTTDSGDLARVVDALGFSVALHQI